MIVQARVEAPPESSLESRCVKTPHGDGLRSQRSLVPQLVEVKEVAPLPNGGHRLRFVTLGRRGKLCEWVSEQVERVPNELVIVRAHTEGISTTATRRFERTAQGSRLAGEVKYHFDVTWPQKVLLPLMEYQARRPMRKQLRSVLELVKVRTEAS